jgi:hypothetical protein
MRIMIASVQLENKITGRESQGAYLQDELTDWLESEFSGAPEYAIAPEIWKELEVVGVWEKKLQERN